MCCHASDKCGRWPCRGETDPPLLVLKTIGCPPGFACEKSICSHCPSQSLGGKYMQEGTVIPLQANLEPHQLSGHHWRRSVCNPRGLVQPTHLAPQRYDQMHAEQKMWPQSACAIRKHETKGYYKKKRWQPLCLQGLGKTIYKFFACPIFWRFGGILAQLRPV